MTEQLYIQATRRYGALSPLRYPGGKASLAGYFSDLIGSMALTAPTYVEPYAGGAGAGVALLREGIVDHLVINDIDPAVHAFWLSVTQDNRAFVSRVAETALTVDEWIKQREIYRAGDDSDPLDLGFAFFYLNRTNRSGILNAGVIGGLDQKGNYKIDARFNRDTLTDRIEAIGALSERITVSNKDGRTAIRDFSTDPSVFMYIDPPYVQAGSQLYLNAFDRDDHTALARVIHETNPAHWLMTYDLSPFIEGLYSSYYQCRLKLSYSVKTAVKAEELLIVSPKVAKALQAINDQEQAAADV